jgi:hypothetical protein
MRKRLTEREKSVVIMIITNSSRTKPMTDEFNKIKGHYASTRKTTMIEFFVLSILP